MNNKIQLNSEQRSYLIRLKSSMNTKYSDLTVNKETTEFLGATHLRESIRFLRKIITNQYYRKTSASKIKRVAERYHHLIE